LQDSLAMEVEAELDAEANELNAALLDAEHSASSLQLTTSSDTLDGGLPSSELPPLPIPRLPSQEAADYGEDHDGESFMNEDSGPSSTRKRSSSPPLPSTLPSLAQARKRSPSPASLRHAAIAAPVGLSSFTTVVPRSYTIEAICALPHPSPTHALASSYDMTHLITGSDDGYIRNYDIFSAVNGKTFLSAPQRHHAGVVEGLLKAGQVKFWWENPAMSERKVYSGGPGIDDDAGLDPVYSMLMHSDALWALGGTRVSQTFCFLWRMANPHIPRQVT
jgi:transcriptional activator SPT8